VNNIKRLLCQWESPELVAYKLIQEWGEAGFIWLDGDGSDLGRWVTLGINPLDQFCSRGLEISKKDFVISFFKRNKESDISFYKIKSDICMLIISIIGIF